MMLLAWPFVVLVAVLLLFAFGWRWAAGAHRYAAEVRQLRETAETFVGAAQKLDERLSTMELVVKRYEDE